MRLRRPRQGRGRKQKNDRTQNSGSSIPRLHEHGGHGGAHGRVGDEHRRVKVLSLVDELRKGQTPREGGARELILRRLTVERGHD